MKKIYLTATVFIFYYSSLFATTAGPNITQTATNDASNSGTYAWGTPSNAQTNDNVCTSTTANGTGTQYLRAENFGFAIPAGVTISGITATIEISSTPMCADGDGDAIINCDIQDLEVKLIKGGVIGGNNNASSLTWSTGACTAGTVRNYGNSSDLWGLAWTDADINAANFGIVISAYNTIDPFDFKTVRIDYISITVEYTASLAIDLLKFTAAPIDNKTVQLNWQTSSEINNNYFTIERSNDGNNFENIGKVKGAGNSNVINNYQFTDSHNLPDGSQVSHLTSHILYYRLKQTDFDGKNTYSKTVSITIERLSKVINIYPNPANTILNCEVFSLQEGIINIQVIDILGNVVMKEETKATKGIKLNISNLSQGMYFVKTNNTQIKFVKE